MSSDGYFDDWQVQSAATECTVADLMALVRNTAKATGGGEYDIRVGIDFTGDQPLAISTIDNFGYHYDGASVPLHRYRPVELTVNTSESDLDFYWHVHAIAHDCVNHGSRLGLAVDDLTRPTPPHPIR